MTSRLVEHVQSDVTLASLDTQVTALVGGSGDTDVRNRARTDLLLARCRSHYAPLNVSPVPDAPNIGAATAGNAQVSVAFTQPAKRPGGGSAPTSYTATSTPGSFTKTGTASPLVVTGLTNDTGYTFKVKATNRSGDSADSAASATATPVAP